MPDIEDKPSNRLRNRLKGEKDGTEIEDVKEPKEKKEKKAPAKDQAATKEKHKFFLLLNTYWTRYVVFFSDPKVKRISGLLLLLGGIYLSLAFISFLFTWKTDQDKVMGSWADLFFNDLSLDNWLGKLGAILSHVFIHKWFGIASFLFPFIAYYAGIKNLLLLPLIKLKPVIAHSFFLLIFVSITLGFLFNDKWFFLGGTFGYQLSNWFNLSIGKAGTLLLLVFTALTYAVVSYNITFYWKPKEKEVIPPPLAATEPNAPTSESASNKIIKPIEPNNQPDVNHFEEVEAEESEPFVVAPIVTTNDVIFELPTPLPVPPVEAPVLDKADNIDFTIEQIEPAPEDTSGEVLPVTEGKIDILKEFGVYDPTLDLSSYQLPSIDLLEDYKSNDNNVNTEELTANKDRIVNTLKNYGIEIEKVKANVGPTVTLYEIIPKAGVRIAKIKSLEDDIALSLSALGIRIIAPIPGKGTIGIEVPNQSPQTVSMRSIIASDKFQNTTLDLPIALGKTISNETFIADLAKMPHLLMAGATGQGKSVGLNAILVSLLYKKHPSQVKFVLVDPKKVELTLFNKIERHFLAKLPDSEEAIITDNKKVINTLNSLCIEMDNRYELLKDAMVRNIKEYNVKFTERKLNPNEGHKFLPYIILVVDEFADLIMTAGKEVETPIARLAQLARAIGIHLIIATQRPSVNIITGTIKANFPARIAFRVTSKIDSRTILDSGGADQLIGRGDMLLSTGNDLIRIQCAFVDTPEVEKITAFIGGQRGYPHAFNLPEYIDESGDGNGAAELNTADRDKLFDDAARIIVAHQQGSASLLQRKLKLGYNRAGRIVDQLEAAGIIGPFEGSKARDVLIKDMQSLEQFLNRSGEDAS